MTDEVELTYRSEDTPGAVVICLKGEIDCTHSNELTEWLKATQESARKDVVIDLSEVDYIDSSGLGALVGERMRCLKQGRRFRLCSPKPVVQTVLQTSRLDHYFDVYPTREAALAEGE